MRVAFFWGIIDADFDTEAGRRDDLEALGYVLLYFVRGTLPWLNIQAETEAQEVVLMVNRKADMPLEELCRDLPEQFLLYMRHVRGLGFREKPNYRYLRLLFSNLFLQKGYKNDNVFHWTEWRYRQLRGESFPALGM